MKIIKLALQNIWSRKSTSLKISISLILISTLLMIMLSYNYAINMQYADILSKATSLNFLELFHHFKLEQEEMDFLESLPGVREILAVEHEGFARSNKEFLVKLDENTYSYGDEETFSFTIINSFDSKLVSQNEYSEFEYYSPSESICYGRDTVNEKEIVLSYYFFKELSLNVEDVLNKTITLGYKYTDIIHDGIYRILEDYKVVGIFKKLFDDTIRVVRSKSPAIYIKKDIEKEHSAFYTYMYLDSYRSKNDIATKVSNYFYDKGKLFTPFKASHNTNKSEITYKKMLVDADWDEEPTELIYVPSPGIILPNTVEVRFSRSFIVSLYMSIESQREMVNTILLTISILLGILAIASTVMLLFFEIQRKGIYFGVLKAQGMSRIDIFFVIFTELMLLFLGSTILAAVIVASLINIIGGITLDLLNVSLTLNIKDYLNTVFVAIGVETVLTSLISMFLINVHIKQDVVRLL